MKLFGWILLIACAWNATAASAAEPIAREHGLRIVSFNLYNRPWQRGDRLLAAAETLQALQADVVALQEVAQGLWLPGNPMEIIGSAIGLPHQVRYWHERNLGIFRTGLALLSRYPIEESEYHEFERHRWLDPKGFLFARVMHPAGEIGIINLHIASTRDAEIKTSEFGQLAAFIEGLPRELPLVVLGDFNEESDTALSREFFKRVEARHLYERYPALTSLKTWSPDYEKGCNQPGKGERLDSILTLGRGSGKQWRWQDGKVVISTSQPHPSDHCPVMADLSLESSRAE